ncbi:MAG: hypothetical protein WCL14_14670 [Bacteroidota bacterium]
MNSQDLEVYRLDLVLIQETADRIIKDFDLFGFVIQFSGNKETAYGELKEQLLPVFNGLLSNNRQKLMRMLYIIDISERKLSNMIRNYPDESMGSIISHLVIERELQKVITRRFYSPKKLD